MKTKKDEFYFNNLCECAECSYQAAKFLEQVIREYNKDTIEQKIHAMHETEQSGDAKKHQMMEVLNKAFITPIEREDIVALSDNLDDITDAIEEVLLQIYICNVTKIRDDVLPTIHLLLECIQCLWDVLKEFHHFKTSTTITNHIVRVNDFEEQGDHLYKDSMYRLHREEELRSIVTWRTIYECIEKCFDTCEHTADIVQTVIMKNT